MIHFLISTAFTVAIVVTVAGFLLAFECLLSKIYKEQ